MTYIYQFDVNCGDGHPLHHFEKAMLMLGEKRYMNIPQFTVGVYEESPA